jgi:REP element-mobilizing transposase RayT
VWHHVWNRGIARRPTFERNEDVRYFKALMAKATRRGEIEIHAYVVLTTHFHLLLRSPNGRLSEGLRRIQNGYVRWFNRRRKRDGPLFRGRFGSKPVESLTYRQTLVKYIDQNAPHARLVHAARLYPHGSAADYARSSGPPWLCRTWIESAAAGAEPFTSMAYAKSFGARLGREASELVERRMQHPGHGPDPLDELVGAAPAAVRAWMQRKAKLADGTRPGIPLVPPRRIRSELETARKQRPDWTLRHGSNEIDLWSVLCAWLLRHAGGQTQAEVALRMRIPPGSLNRLEGLHRRLLGECPDYEHAAIRVAEGCFGRSGSA